MHLAPFSSLHYLYHSFSYSFLFLFLVSSATDEGGGVRLPRNAEVQVTRQWQVNPRKKKCNENSYSSSFSLYACCSSFSVLLYFMVLCLSRSRTCGEWCTRDAIRTSGKKEKAKTLAKKKSERQRSPSHPNKIARMPIRAYSRPRGKLSDRLYCHELRKTER